MSIARHLLFAVQAGWRKSQPAGVEGGATPPGQKAELKDSRQNSGRRPRRECLSTSMMALAASMLMLLLVACGETKPTPPAAAAPATTAKAAPGDILARVTKEKRVRIGVKADTPPFGTKVGDTFTGFDIDIAMAVAKQLGIEQVDFVPVTSANRIVKLLNGDVDMLVASMTITRYRELKVDFAYPPYFQDGEGLLVKQGSPIQSYLDLAGKTVGCVKGSTSSYYMKQVAPDCATKVYPDFAAMMQGLAADEVEAVTSDTLILIGLMKNAADPAAYRIAGDRFTTEPYGIAVLENQSKWRDAISDALQDLWENGRWQVICDSWFGPGTKYETQLKFVITPFPH
jgi:polar amino acid transport system substrate-binding protein